MKLAVLLTYLDDEGTMPERWGSVVLVRDRSQAADSERAWEVVPVVDIRGDEAGRTVEVITARPTGKERVRELSARMATSRLKKLARTHASARLYVARPGREHVRVAGATADPDLHALAFVEWFKGVESEL